MLFGRLLQPLFVVVQPSGRYGVAAEEEEAEKNENESFHLFSLCFVISDYS